MVSIINKSNNTIDLEKNDSIVTVICNWDIENGGNINETISIIQDQAERERSQKLDAYKITEPCVKLYSNKDNNEGCKINLKLSNNQRIKYIAIASEAKVLEFYKNYGEYSSTTFTKLVDNNENQEAYIGEAVIDPPSPEVSIKFLQLCKQIPKMWLYSIKLILVDTEENDELGFLNYDIMNELLKTTLSMKKSSVLTGNTVTNALCNASLDHIENSFLNSNSSSLTSQEISKLNKSEQKETDETEFKFKQYLDYKLNEMEQRFTDKIEALETRINKKLDIILGKLEK